MRLFYFSLILEMILENLKEQLHYLQVNIKKIGIQFQHLNIYFQMTRLIGRKKIGNMLKDG